MAAAAVWNMLKCYLKKKSCYSNKLETYSLGLRLNRCGSPLCVSGIVSGLLSSAGLIVASVVGGGSRGGLAGGSLLIISFASVGVSCCGSRTTVSIFVSRSTSRTYSSIRSWSCGGLISRIVPGRSLSTVSCRCGGGSGGCSYCISCLTCLISSPCCGSRAKSKIKNE